MTPGCQQPNFCSVFNTRWARQRRGGPQRGMLTTMSNALINLQERPQERKEAGRLTRLMMRWFFRKATVSKIEALASDIRAISLAGDDLKAASWAPGHKIQIDVGGGINRTYTPVCWSDTGETRIIAFSHGEGPGAGWASSVRPGDKCQFFGPRRSMDLRHLNVERPFFFGDETSLGLAQALSDSMDMPQDVTCLFEMSAHPDPRSLLLQLGLPEAAIVKRRPADGHYQEIEARIGKIVAEIRPGAYVLSGRSASVQRVSRMLKGLGVEPALIRAKAHWATGKTGLD